jgi:hypothetical protein
MNSFVRELDEMRRAHIGYDNQEFNDRMKEMYAQSLRVPSNAFESLRSELVEAVRKHPDVNEHSVTYSLDLSPLFARNKANANTLGQYKLWFLNETGNLRGLTMDLPLNEELFLTYLITADPVIQELRAKLHDEFPGADIFHHLEVNDETRSVQLILVMSYCLPPIGEEEKTLQMVTDMTMPSVWRGV